MKVQEILLHSPKFRKKNHTHKLSMSPLVKARRKVEWEARRGRIWHWEFFLTILCTSQWAGESNSRGAGVDGHWKCAANKVKRADLLCTCRSISRISVKRSRRSIGSCSITVKGRVRQRGGANSESTRLRHCVRACVRRGEGVERAAGPERGCQLPWERNIPRLPLPPAIPPSCPLALSPARRSRRLPPPALPTHFRDSPLGTTSRAFSS